MKPTEKTPEQPSTARPLAERIAAVQQEADKLGPVDPSFDQKEFSNGL